jgi:hypothetical protein
MGAARIWCPKLIAAGGEVAHRGAAANHDDLVFEESRRDALRIESLGEIDGGEGVLRAVIIDPALPGRLARFFGRRRAEDLGGFPGRGGNIARAGK